VAAFKPALTGLDEPAVDWPRDHELLASAANAGQSPEEVAPVRFGPPVSPHHAAELAGAGIEPLELVDAACTQAGRADVLVCEGVGGLMVPLTSGYLIRDFALDLDLPLVIAARPGLGTISHSLLTVEAASAAGLRVAAVVMTPWPPKSDDLVHSNRETVERLGSVRVTGLQPTRPDRASLASAGGALPVEEWLEP
jgi:dethiobiotin synthetase